MDTVAAISAAVRSGGARPDEVVAEHLRRHRESHGRINALIQPVADLEAAGGGMTPSGPLAGVPVSIKECFPVRGLRTTLGITRRRDVIDAVDADIVVRLRAAGAVIVGKANVPQAMYLHETDNPVWGRTRHPLDPDRSPGGSSGGDAALVAAGVVPLAVGNDLAGSLRQPAHACGIATIMPRSAALGGGGAVRTMPDLAAVASRAGFLATRTADLRIALDAVGVPSDAFPGQETVRGMRIGWWDDGGPIPAATAIVRGVHEAVARLRCAGAEIVAIDNDITTEAAWLHLALLAADGGKQVRSLFRGARPMPEVARLLRLAGMPRWLRISLATLADLAGRHIEATALRATGPLAPSARGRLLERRDAVAARWTAATAGCAAVVGPVSALPALRHGTAARLLLAAAPCLLANLLDLAAGAVPVTTVAGDEQLRPASSRDPVLALAEACLAGSAGLPVGVQVVAAPDRGEATVLAVMEAIEAAD